MKLKAQNLTPAERPAIDPALDAARLLGWVGFGALMIVAPLVGVLSRRALFILLPVGGGILAAAYLLILSVGSRAGLKAFGEALLQPIGQSALFLAGWTGLSLFWTPYVEDAVPRYVATLAVAAMAAFVIANLPERRTRPTLYLLPAGVAITAITTAGMALFGPISFRGGTEFDPSLLERSVLTLVLLVWPALGALGAFGRWVLAGILATLVAVVVSLAWAQLAMAAFSIAAMAFALADSNPRRIAQGGAAVSAVLILLSPVLPFILAPLAASIPMVGKSTVLAMSDWRDIVTSDGVRLITGHGFDTAGLQVLYGALPLHTPRSILFEVWYELGILGALALAGAFSIGFLAAANAAKSVAPAMLSGMTATMIVAISGVATAELWFVTLVSLQAIGFGLLARSSRDAVRPVMIPAPPARGGYGLPDAMPPNV